MRIGNSREEKITEESKSSNRKILFEDSKNRKSSSLFSSFPLINKRLSFLEREFLARSFSILFAEGEEAFAGVEEESEIRARYGIVESIVPGAVLHLRGEAEEVANIAK